MIGTRSMWLAFACAGLVWVGPQNGAMAQAPSHEKLVSDGAALAERLCSSCHLVGSQKEASANVGVPTLRMIANAPGQTAVRIRNVLINPHPPMPDVRLSNPEIDRLLAYIDSMRSDAAGAPLVPRNTTPPRPQYPDPS